MNTLSLFFIVSEIVLFFTYGTRSRELARGVKVLLLVNIAAICITATHKGTKYC